MDGADNTTIFGRERNQEMNQTRKSHTIHNNSNNNNKNKHIDSKRRKKKPKKNFEVRKKMTLFQPHFVFVFVFTRTRPNLLLGNTTNLPLLVASSGSKEHKQQEHKKKEGDGY